MSTRDASAYHATPLKDRVLDLGARTVDSDGFPCVESVGEDEHFHAAGFHGELRRRNLQILFWATVIFNIAYVSWGVFDYILLPEKWKYFLVLRIACVVLNSLVLMAVLRLGEARFSWEGLWAIGFTYCAFIALMLPYTGDSLSRYVMGFAVVLLAGGVVPVWPPRWGVSVLLVSVAFGALVFVVSWPSNISVRDVVGGGFVIGTSLGLSFLATVFKYDLAKRDYLSRLRLSSVAKRESEARLSLAQTSHDLQEALEKLEEVDRLKSKFFANISHELRTPLTLILAPVEELAGTVVLQHHKQQLRVIRRNAERLLGLINDLLDLSRLDAGGLRLNLAEMDIRSVVAAVCENSQPAALAKSIDCLLYTSPSPRDRQKSRMPSSA
jgi:signal transduction histidine kinase